MAFTASERSVPPHIHPPAAPAQLYADEIDFITSELDRLKLLK
jgi:hypothetical protein